MVLLQQPGRLFHVRVVLDLEAERILHAQRAALAAFLAGRQPAHGQAQAGELVRQAVQVFLAGNAEAEMADAGEGERVSTTL